MPEERHQFRILYRDFLAPCDRSRRPLLAWRHGKTARPVRRHAGRVQLQFSDLRRTEIPERRGAGSAAPYCGPQRVRVPGCLHHGGRGPVRRPGVEQRPARSPRFPHPRSPARTHQDGVSGKDSSHRQRARRRHRRSQYLHRPLVPLSRASRRRRLDGGAPGLCRILAGHGRGRPVRVLRDARAARARRAASALSLFPARLELPPTRRVLRHPGGLLPQTSRCGALAALLVVLRAPAAA